MADLLLVDNDARITELVALFLRRSGHAVRTAESFAAARAEIARARPDLMLSDLDLGAERGLDELPRLAAEGLLPPTVVVSGYLDRASQLALERIPGVVDALAKPFDLVVLRERIATALARATARANASATGIAGSQPPDADSWLDLPPSGASA